MTDRMERLRRLPPERLALLVGELESRLERAQSAAREPVAITGMACRFPGAASPAELWRLLQSGGDAITPIPPERWDAAAFYDADPDAAGKMSTRWGGFLDGVDRFDPEFFGISPREALRMDPQQRLLLEVAWEALEDAGETRESLAGSRAGVFVGAYNHEYSALHLSRLDEVDAYTGTGIALNAIAGRLSYLLDLRGPALVVDTACSSSLVAAHLAVQSLRAGECDLAVVGGVNVLLTPMSLVPSSRMRMLAPDGRCKTFDARADGVVIGEGCGVVVLKRLRDARAGGDPVRAVVRGTAANQDGRSNGLTAPRLPAQRQVLRAALEQAGVDPATVDLVETHGTGTPLGDPIEVEALLSVYGAPRADGRRCALGAAKASIGHAGAAAGVASLIKAVLSLQEGEIPPHPTLRELSPHLPLAGSALEVPTAPRPWPAGDVPRRAAASSFGWSGTNVHVVLEEAPATPPAHEDDGREYVLPLSARTPAALVERAAAVRAALEVAAAAGSPSARDLCWTAAARRTHHEHRLAVVGRDTAELAARLAEVGAGPVPGAPLGIDAPARRRGVAFVFSGQGAQWAGMGARLLDEEPAFRQAVEEVDDAFRPLAGWSVVEEMRAEAPRLERTDVAQPLLFALQMGLWRVWSGWGIAPDAVVGHSVGEAAAACAAGVLSVEDGARVVFHRGRLMQRAAGLGRMAAVELPAEEAAREAEGAGAVWLAAENGPAASVLAGEEAPLAALLEQLRARQVATRWMDGAFAFHTPQMEPMRAELGAALAPLAPRAATIPLCSTVTGAWAAPGDYGAAYWERNLRQPVRFAPAVEALMDSGVELFVELGPHPVLGRAVAQAYGRRGAEGVVLPSMRRGQGGRATLLGSLAALYGCGHPVEWRRLFPAGGRCVALPGYPWQHRRFWPGFGAAAAPRTGGHPLLGTRIETAGSEIVFQAEVGEGTHSYLADHRFFGRAVVPGAAFLAMAAAAAGEALGTAACALEDVVFPAPLSLEDGETRTVQLVLAPREGGMSFRVSSRAPSAPGAPAAWTLHASGTMAADAAGDAHPSRNGDSVRAPVSGEDEHPFVNGDSVRSIGGWGDAHPPMNGDSAHATAGVSVDAGASLNGDGHPSMNGDSPPSAVDQADDGIPAEAAAALAACGEALSVDDFHRTLAKAGLELGPAYRVLEPFRRGPGRAVARVAPAADAGPAPLHPLLLDACLQVVGAAAPDDAEHAYMPLHVQRLRVLTPERGPLWSLATFRRVDDETATADLRLLAADGTLVAEVAGLRTRRVTREALAGAGAATGWLHRVEWRPLAPARDPHRKDGLMIVAAREDGLAARLRAELERRGDRASIALLPPGATLDDVRRMIGDARGGGLRGIVHLAVDNDDADPAEAADAACAAALPVLQAVAGGAAPGARVWLVTRNAQRVDGEPAAGIGGAALWGMGAVAALEHPDAWGGLIDVDADDDVAALAAVLRAGDEDRVAIRAGRAWGARLAAAPAPRDAGPLRLRADGTYLVTGGLGGVGVRVARRLAERGAGHLLLVGRSEPSAAALAAVEEMRALGAAVTLARADVADGAALAAVLAEAERALPPLRGVVHAAGVLDDGPLVGQSAGRVARVLAPKARGGWNLHRLTRGAPLDFFVLFSSIAGLFGAAGQAGYAAGNAFLDALARRRRAEGLPALSILWAPWEGAGMAGALSEADTRRLRERGIDPLPHDDALALFERLLVSADAEAVVVPPRWLAQAAGSMPLLSALRAAAPAAAETRASAPAAFRARLAAAAPAERRGLLEREVSRLAAQALGLPTTQPLDPRRPLREAGLDSLGSVELRNALAAALGCDLPATLLFDHPSVNAITGFVAPLILPAASPTAAAVSTEVVDPPVETEIVEDAAADGLRAILAELDALSEADARRALGAASNA